MNLFPQSVRPLKVWVGGSPLWLPRLAATSAGGGRGGVVCKCGCNLINRRAKWLSQSRLESITVISLSARSRFPPSTTFGEIDSQPPPLHIPHQPFLRTVDKQTGFHTGNFPLVRSTARFQIVYHSGRRYSVFANSCTRMCSATLMETMQKKKKKRETTPDRSL